MTANHLLNEAAQLGLHIISDGTNLRIRPGRLCPPAFANTLRAHKRELLALLANAKPSRAPQIVKPHRPLTEREWAILVRAGAENDPIIIEALNLFHGKIVDPGDF